MDDSNNTYQPQEQQPLPPQQPTENVEQYMQPPQPQPQPAIAQPAEQFEAVAQPYGPVYGQQLYPETNTQVQNDGLTPKFMFEVSAFIVAIIVIIGLLTGFIAIGVSGVVLFFIVGLVAILASFLKLKSIKPTSDGAKRERSIWAIIGISLLFVIGGAAAIMGILFVIGIILIMLFLSTGPQT